MGKVQFIEGYSCSLKGRGTSVKHKFQESGADYSNKIKIETPKIPTHKELKRDLLREKFPFNATDVYFADRGEWMRIDKFIAVSRVKQMFPNATECVHVRTYFENVEASIEVVGKSFVCADVVYSDVYKLYSDTSVHEVLLPNCSIALVCNGVTVGFRNGWNS